MTETRLLSRAELPCLLPLLAAYMAEMRPVLAGSEAATPEAALGLLAEDPRAEVLLAARGGEATGFAVFFDLPELVFARRCGALDDLFVRPEARGQGAARAMLDALLALGRGRRWSHLRWIVPEGDAAAIALYERVAARAPWRSYVIRLDPGASL